MENPSESKDANRVSLIDIVLSEFKIFGTFSFGLRS